MIYWGNQFNNNDVIDLRIEPFIRFETQEAIQKKKFSRKKTVLILNLWWCATPI